MTNFTMPNTISFMKDALQSVPGLADVGVPHGVEYGTRTTPRCVGQVWKKFQMTIFYRPDNVSSMKYALKLVPGLVDVRVPHGDGDGPRTPPRCMEGVWKKFQVTNFNMPNKVSYMKNALVSVPGLPDVGVLHGGEDGPRTLAPGSGSKICGYHVDQCKKLKGFDG